MFRQCIPSPFHLESNFGEIYANHLSQDRNSVSAIQRCQEGIPNPGDVPLLHLNDHRLRTMTDERSFDVRERDRRVMRWACRNARIEEGNGAICFLLRERARTKVMASRRSPDVWISRIINKTAGQREETIHMYNGSVMNVTSDASALGDTFRDNDAGRLSILRRFLDEVDSVEVESVRCSASE